MNEGASIAVFVTYYAILFMNYSKKDSDLKRYAEENPATFAIGGIIVLPGILGVIAGLAL